MNCCQKIHLIHCANSKSKNPSRPLCIHALQLVSTCTWKSNSILEELIEIFSRSVLTRISKFYLISNPLYCLALQYTTTCCSLNCLGVPAIQFVLLNLLAHRSQFAYLKYGGNKRRGGTSSWAIYWLSLSRQKITQREYVLPFYV